MVVLGLSWVGTGCGGNGTDAPSGISTAASFHLYVPHDLPPDYQFEFYGSHNPRKPAKAVFITYQTAQGGYVTIAEHVGQLVVAPDATTAHIQIGKTRWYRLAPDEIEASLPGRVAVDIGAAGKRPADALRVFAESLERSP